LDCYTARLGDKTLVTKFLKMREYETIIKALKAEADKLADKVELYGLADKWQALLEADQKLRTLIRDYLTKEVGSDRERRVLEDVESQEQKVQELANQVQTYLEKQALRKKAKPQVQQSYEV
jgi:hypothetical protein